MQYVRREELLGAVEALGRELVIAKGAEQFAHQHVRELRRVPCPHVRVYDLSTVTHAKLLNSAGRREWE